MVSDGQLAEADAVDILTRAGEAAGLGSGEVAATVRQRPAAGERMTLTLASQQAADKILQPVVDPIKSLRAAAGRPPEECTPAVTDALSALTRSGMDAATETIARDFIKRGRLLQPLTAFDRIVREARAESGQKSDPERKSASTELVEIACERYEFGLGDGGQTFAVAKAGPRIALLLRGGRMSLRGQLARDYFARTARAAAQQALADALMVTEGMAQEEEESRLYLRTGSLRLAGRSSNPLRPGSRERR
jgi:hypothetical protein